MIIEFILEAFFFFLQESVTVDSHTGTQHKIDF